MFGSNTMKLEKCPLTGLEIIKQKAKIDFETSDIYYKVEYDEQSYFMGLCSDKLYAMLSENYEYGKERYPVDKLKKYLPIFFGELGKLNFKELFNKTIHWDCNPLKAEEPDKHLSIKPFVELIKAKYNYPKTRKEKTNLILKKIEQEQEQDGGQIKMLGEFKYWGQCFMHNAEELEYYLKQLEKKGLVEIDYPYVNLTLDGLEYTEKLLIMPPKLKKEEEYDIGLSFAGENRDYVEQVAEALRLKEVKVFYDNYEAVDLWGKDLYQHLNDIYKNKCEYCIIFISEHYARKLWTNHELKSAQTRAFEENREYILPVRFDNTDIPGLNKTVGYIDANAHTPERIAQLAFEKLNL